MPSVRAGDLRIAYEERGAGDPVLLINGTGEPGSSWEPQVDALAERWRCVAIDNRDVGHSDYATASYTPADMAQDVAAVIASLDLGPCHVVGYSLGGAVAQELALAQPGLVRSLVLLATWHRSDGWFRSQMRQWQALRRALEDEDAFMRALAPWLYAPATFDDPARLEGLIREAVELEPQQRPDGWIRQCDADIAHDAASRLGSLSQPALVLVGDDDVCTPPRYARRIAELVPRAELVTVPGAAHAAPQEQPAAVNAAIARFLAGH